MKKIALMMFLTLASVALPIRLAAKANTIPCTKQYPETGIVTVINLENDFVEFETYSGNVFSFYGCDNWHVGDVVSAIMNDNGTDAITDDEVIKVQYSGQAVWMR